MSDKNKYYLVMLLLSILLILGIEIELIGAPGNYILRALGLAVWSNGDTGLHMIVIYITVPVIICFIELGVFRRRLSYSKLKTFVLLLIMITVVKSAAIKIVEFSKGQSTGLHTIALHGDTSTYHMSKRDGVTDYNIQVNLTNYSDEKKTFTMAVDGKHRRRKGEQPLHILNKDGSKALFELNAKETRIIRITPSEFGLDALETNYERDSYSVTGQVLELNITDENNKSVKLFGDSLHSESIINLNDRK